MNSDRERRRVSIQSTPYLTEDIVSDYLKSHQDFLIRWLTENTTKEIVEVFAKKLRDKSFTESAPGGPSGNRGATDTKTSGLNVPENLKNSITSQIFRRYLEGDRSRKAPAKKDRTSLQRMSEEDLFMELIRDIASELDVNMLCHKILQNVSILTNSDRSSLFLVRGSRDNKHLVSKLFDVTESSTLEEVIHTESNEIKVPFGKGIVGIVAQTAKPINIADAYEDPRFNQEIDRLTGYRTHSILSMPIVNYEGEVIGVAQIINKISSDHQFTSQDEALFRKYLIFCGIGLTNAQLFEMSVNEFKRNQLLLHLARGIFEEQTNLEKLVQKIMLDAQDLLKCEKCCVYLLEDTCERDIPRFTQAFLSRLGTYSRNPLVLSMQGFKMIKSTEEFLRMATKLQRKDARPKDPTATQKKAPASPIPDTAKPKTPEEVVFSKAFSLCAKDGTVTVPSAQVLAVSKTALIAKFVVTSGEPVNVADCDNDGRFGAGPCNDTTGNRIKNVLCMPIHNSDKNIIGVTQLINKINGQPFNDNDVNIIEAFSIFTGLGIHNCQMYENACQLMAKQSVALEVLSFHATAHAEETNTLMNSDVPSAEEMCLYHFDFDDKTLDDDGTLRACIRMFLEADIINSFKIPYDVMCRWLCTVKKNYRPVTYHNWRHAFNVCQTMFSILYTGDLVPLFEELEVFTLLAACLCHDLDHRGTNNAFQTKVASPLAMLYSTSVLEHHHFDHSIMILNSEGNNIFQSLSPEEYRRAIKLVEHAILSTDLALYFKKRGDFKKMVESGEKSFAGQQQRALLRAMMMTACDVSAITKPWKIQQETAQLVMAEFFEQGDIERYQLGEQPIPMMDRNKKDELPKMQVGFIDAICTPVYKLFAVITERLAPLYAGCEGNRQRWQEQADRHQARLLALSETQLQEGELLDPKALPSQDDSQQGVHSQQAVHAELGQSSTQHQQTQTDDPQTGPLRQQQQQNHPHCHPLSALRSSSHPSPGRQPQESQLGSAARTPTTTSTTTSPPSPLRPSPQDLSKTPQLDCHSRASSHPSLLHGLSQSSQTDSQARASSHPSILNGHSKASQPGSEGQCSPFPCASRQHLDRLFHAQPEYPVSCDLLLAPSVGSSPILSHPGNKARAMGGPCQTAPVVPTAMDCSRVGPGQETQPRPSHLHQNGHATAQQKTSPEVCTMQSSIPSWQTPSHGTSPHRKLKPLAQVQAQAQPSSSKNAHKSGLCILS